MTNIQTLLAERNLPELLKFADGKDVTAENWGQRRKEILSILENEIYGNAPEAPAITVTKTNVKQKYSEFAGKAVTNEVTISFEPGDAV